MPGDPQYSYWQKSNKILTMEVNNNNKKGFPQRRRRGHPKFAQKYINI